MLIICQGENKKSNQYHTNDQYTKRYVFGIQGHPSCVYELK